MVYNQIGQAYTNHNGSDFMANRGLLNFNDLDNFFMVFIGAWVGTQADKWGKDFLNLVLLILFLFIFVLVLEGIKELVETLINKSGKKPTIFYWLCIFVLFLLIGAIDHYFETADKAACGVLYLMWLIFSVAASLSSTRLKMTDE
jgi:uncharacterized membrane protein YoaK (UPF0700 family)